MAEAEVGDDVWGDDPTVIALEAETARILGKEAAVYVPSGTMGNQAAVRAQTRRWRRDPRAPDGPRGRPRAGRRRRRSRASSRRCSTASGARSTSRRSRRAWHDASDVHYARQSLVCVENTVGEAGGLVVAPERISDIAAFAREHDMRVHMDGARLWNAAVALGLPPAAVVADVDSVSVCFSKGLGAPVGSAVAGDADLIQQVRRNRKLFGGGMRQAGIIAAGALHALRHHVERLADDHRNARRLAEGLAGARRIRVEPDVGRDEHRAGGRAGRDRPRRWSTSWPEPACWPAGWTRTRCAS